MIAPRVLRALLVVTVLALGAACAVAAMLSESMNADGMCYLDVAEAYLEGNLDDAVNPVWSPLYAWILAAARRLVEPTIEWAFPLVHAVNFVLFVLAYAAFAFFWREVGHSASDLAAADPEERVTFGPRGWALMGHALFAWCALAMIEIWSVTPDMLVATAVFAAAALLVRARRGGARAWEGAGLGAALGLGYLAKAAVFPVAFVMLALYAVAGATAPGNRSRIRGALRALPALLVFAAVGGPFLVVLSERQGGVTFSDVGAVTYLKHVHQVPFPHYLPGFVEIDDAPDHPARIVHDDPTVYEFAEPVGGTYPLSFDPYHWFRGMDAPFDLRRQAVAIAVNGGIYADLVIRHQGGIAAALLVLLLAGVSLRCLRTRWDAWHGELVLVALAACGMYLLVHVTPRYVAPYCVLFWAGVASAVRLPAGLLARRALAAGACVVALAAAADLAVTTGPEGANFLGIPRGTEVFSHDLAGREPGRPVGPVRWAADRPSRVARGVLASGLEPGDRVGYIGNSFDAYWAHLADLKIVAEIVPGEAARYWDAEPATRDSVARAFRDAGAVAVVSAASPARPDTETGPWRPVPGTGYLLLALDDTRWNP